MDFLRLNNEFQKLQKQLDNSKLCIKKINSYINTLNKKIIKLEQENEREIDSVHKHINLLIIEIYKTHKSALENIIKCEESQIK